jgi:hypothetical protein
VTSIVPRFVHIVGFRNTVAGVPDAFGAFTVTVNDAAGAPIVGAQVVLDFGACIDMCLCSDAAPTGQVVNCDGVTCRGTVTNITGAGGIAAFEVIGAGTMPVVVPPAIAPGPGAGCIAISAGPPGGPYVLLGNATCVHLDLNGALPAVGDNGINALDLSYVKQDLGAAGLGAPYRGRSDWNLDGILNAIDLAAWKLHFMRSAAGQGSAGGCSVATVISYCP